VEGSLWQEQETEPGPDRQLGLEVRLVFELELILHRKYSLSISLVNAWNSLPDNVMSAERQEAFKPTLKAWRRTQKDVKRKKMKRLKLNKTQ